MKQHTTALAAAILILLSIWTAGCTNSSSATDQREKVKVERVVDGDTFDVVLDGKKQKVRLIGIDTPETKKPNTPVMYYGKEAADYSKKRLENKYVALEWDVERKDQYDRLLAYVWIDDELYNSTLLREGYARLATFPPNVKYVDDFKQDQAEARKQGKGLWKNYDAAFDTKKK
ncbi:thermonuclease family protein [Paenibacillus xerothermodurans]|uniref:Thermonuclease n=1 Tax=Paenibacillus xerothermodurans TaxID=1977292 RepID=A0A2W1NFT5_PAEXE|nr:thermonuclease family protein [Paenibacillus xerothermodurans]PZE22540.1 thermonuclease [Paenibacillus xerothermodurans]